MRSFQSQSGTSNLSHLFLFCPRGCLHNPVTMQTRCHCAAAHWPASVSSAAVVAAVAGVVAACVWLGTTAAGDWAPPRSGDVRSRTTAEWLLAAGGGWRHHRTCTPLHCSQLAGPGDEWSPVSWPGHGSTPGQWSHCTDILVLWHFIILASTIHCTALVVYSLQSLQRTFVIIAILKHLKWSI